MKRYNDNLKFTTINDRFNTIKRCKLGNGFSCINIKVKGDNRREVPF